MNLRGLPVLTQYLPNTASSGPSRPLPWPDPRHTRASKADGIGTQFKERRRLRWSSDGWMSLRIRSFRPHASDIAVRRSAELTIVLSAKLRGALIANHASRLASIHILVQHQLPRFLQTQLLLRLQRTQPRGSAKVLPEGGGTHIRVQRQLVHAYGLGEVLLDPRDHPGDVSAWRVRRHERSKLRAMGTRQQTNHDLLLNQRSEVREEERIVERVDQTAQGVE